MQEDTRPDLNVISCGCFWTKIFADIDVQREVLTLYLFNKSFEKKNNGVNMNNNFLSNKILGIHFCFFS